MERLFSALTLVFDILTYFVLYRQVESLTKVLAAEAKINEEMKRCNPLEWAAAMQGLQAQAEEIVCAELIYAEENTNDSLSLPGK